MPRVFLIVLDSLGIGGAPDADQYFNGDVPDVGANTLGHIAKWCIEQRGDALAIPNLLRMGIGRALHAASGFDWPGREGPTAQGTWGAAREVSRGKDTPSGHWELAGLPVPWDWHYFPNQTPCFPESLSRAVADAAHTEGILGNCHASGTRVIEQLGLEHIRSGWPICYTSADSVFQIAAHEEHFGLGRLIDLCKNVAPILHGMRVGRVIARPFIGDAGNFMRTSNRRDFAMTPPGPVLMNRVQDAGGRVIAVGKIGDIFSMAGIDEVHKGPDEVLMEHLTGLLDAAPDNCLVFANFVEFDSLYGHRRDPAGYARHLEWFDAALGLMLTKLQYEDLLVVTADHGNDPTWVGTDHTREQVPVLMSEPRGKALGPMTFADVSDLVLTHLRISA